MLVSRADVENLDCRGLLDRLVLLVPEARRAALVRREYLVFLENED